MEETQTYMIKIKSSNDKFLLVRSAFIKSLKEIEWVLSVEPMKNNLCFYVDTINPLRFEEVLKNLRILFKRESLGEIVDSKIENMYISRSKGDSYVTKEKIKA